MKILVTGAGGQLGLSLQRELAMHEVIPLVHERLDIIDLSAVREAFAAFSPDVVINASAYNNVDGAESDADGAFRLNAVGPRNLSIAAAEKDIAIVHVSTDYVFDGTATEPYHEFDRPNPLSVYGRSKLAGEAAVASVNERHYIVRTALLYHESGVNFPVRMLAQKDKPVVKVVSDQFGSPTYARHLARGIGQLVETGAFGTYHMAGGGGASMYEWTLALFKLCEVSTEVHPVTMAEFQRPASRPRYAVLRTLQQPQIVLPDWEQGLEEFVHAISHA